MLGIRELMGQGRITWNSSRNGAVESCDGSHSHLFRAVLPGTRLASSNHIGLQQRSLQVDVMVHQGFINSRQHLENEKLEDGPEIDLLPSVCAGPFLYDSVLTNSSGGQPMMEVMLTACLLFLSHIGNGGGHDLHQVGSQVLQWGQVHAAKERDIHLMEICSVWKDCLKSHSS